MTKRQREREREKREAELMATRLTVGQLIPSWAKDLDTRTFFAVAKYFAQHPLVDLNTMTKKEFMRIRGIGEKTADEILEVRGMFVE